MLSHTSLSTSGTETMASVEKRSHVPSVRRTAKAWLLCELSTQRSP